MSLVPTVQLAWTLSCVGLGCIVKSSRVSDSFQLMMVRRFHDLLELGIRVAERDPLPFVYERRLPFFTTDFSSLEVSTESRIQRGSLRKTLK